MDRIIVVGNSGSGKSTLAREIASRLKIHYIEADSYFHQPNWEQASGGEFRAKMDELTNGERWVLDGNYFRFLGDVVWPKSDTIVWLDYHITLVLWRVITRTFTRLLRRTELWNGNRESLRMTFSKESIVLWSLNMHYVYRKMFTKLLASQVITRATVVHIKSPREMTHFLEEL